MSDLDPAHLQQEYDIRLEWGTAGARALASVDVAVVVDVLSFTTSVSVGVARGMMIWPFLWRDERAEAFAAERDARLARRREDGLSPAALLYGRPVERLVLPSPNGSTIASALRDAGATVIAASLRNASAVARQLGGRSGTIGVIPSGERWPDDTLRPAAEDLWGAGAVIAGLGGHKSPEAQLAEDAFRSVRSDLESRLASCASGRELIARGYHDDVRLAAELDADAVVPILGPDGAFEAAS